ncbi:hypothetical protein Poly30_36640 [Planctomycetes bacterium Poly30]|uniref:Sulfatase n=1 Tax=Saltatorellus ferox TaxID=2528018 RepID=A0A518EVP5_9BACT|nr:hypothetical protein Poly30_36640 [Planctomycetes bacterium Poly30]
MEPNKNPRRPASRREFLIRSAGGFGAVAAAVLWPELAGASSRAATRTEHPLTPKPPHFKARATNVIFLYMDGGPGQMDTFDPKPELERWVDRPLPIDAPATQFNDIGTVMPSPWKFRPGGNSGLPISDLFPKLREQADKLCVIRSMTSKFPEHTAANYFLHTGHNPAGRPSMGAWCSYGLGSMADDLPGYVIVDGGLMPPGGIECYGSGFLSPSFQGSIFRGQGSPVAHARGRHTGTEREALRRRLLETLEPSSDQGLDPAIEAALDNYELGFKMQAAVPELGKLSGESDATRTLYGLDSEFEATRSFGRQCLLARRLIEKGVRFVQVPMVDVGYDRWDQHKDLIKGHTDNARAVDEPIAGLLADLESRGLLETTLVVFAGEFGRTPMAQGRNEAPEGQPDSRGRDHNPHGFSVWMAGGGVKGGMAHGSTDEFGYFAIEDPLEIHDLHATMLHLLGLDHTKLTYRFDGREMRLTDVHGRVIHPAIA